MEGDIDELEVRIDKKMDQYKKEYKALDATMAYILLRQLEKYYLRDLVL